MSNFDCPVIILTILSMIGISLLMVKLFSCFDGSRTQFYMGATVGPIVVFQQVSNRVFMIFILCLVNMSIALAGPGLYGMMFYQFSAEKAYIKNFEKELSDREAQNKTAEQMRAEQMRAEQMRKENHVGEYAVLSPLFLDFKEIKHEEAQDQHQPQKFISTLPEPAKDWNTMLKECDKKFRKR